MFYYNHFHIYKIYTWYNVMYIYLWATVFSIFKMLFLSHVMYIVTYCWQLIITRNANRWRSPCGWHCHPSVIHFKEIKLTITIYIYAFVMKIISFCANIVFSNSIKLENFPRDFTNSGSFDFIIALNVSSLFIWSKLWMCSLADLMRSWYIMYWIVKSLMNQRRIGHFKVIK